MYAALHYRNGEIPNESVIKATIDYQSYKDVHEKALPKFRYYTQCMAELRKTLNEEIKPLLTMRIRNDERIIVYISVSDFEKGKNLCNSL